jgi:hypothetical protein
VVGKEAKSSYLCVSPQPLYAENQEAEEGRSGALLSNSLAALGRRECVLESRQIHSQWCVNEAMTHPALSSRKLREVSLYSFCQYETWGYFPICCKFGLLVSAFDACSTYPGGVEGVIVACLSLECEVSTTKPGSALPTLNIDKARTETVEFLPLSSLPTNSYVVDLGAL